VSEQQFIEETEIETANENIEISKKKKELSQNQLDHLNNTRVKALEKKREIELKKNKEYEEKVKKHEVIEETIIKSTPDPIIKPDVKHDVKKKKVIKSN
jgi:hypothetical protein